MNRPPIVVILGHIDHGKSTLLDTIRKSNVVASESGGITQHLGAYQTAHDGKMITFLDTPGHEAFSAMRARGARVADIAVLVVSAVEGVQAQTVEAFKAASEARIPVIVAANKMDRPEADAERTKQLLAEKEIFVEGYGGTIPFAPISAKRGDGVPELLDLILLSAEVAGLSGHPEQAAEGVVIESHLSPKRGASAVVIVRDGTLASGDAIAIEGVVSPLRILESWDGKPAKTLGPSSPALIAGLAKVPAVGATFRTYRTKKEAEAAAGQFSSVEKSEKKKQEEQAGVIFPMVVKSDTAGTLEAVERELASMHAPGVACRILSSGVGAITDTDVKIAAAGTNPVLIGFRVKMDRGARDLAEQEGIPVHLFDVIYDLKKFAEEECVRRAPKVMVDVLVGKARILRTFSQTRNTQIVGGSVLEGSIVQGKTAKIFRRDHEIGTGTVVGLQQQKTKVREVETGKQFGAMVESKMTIAEGDMLEVSESREQ